MTGTMSTAKLLDAITRLTPTDNPNAWKTAEEAKKLVWELQARAEQAEERHALCHAGFEKLAVERDELRDRAEQAERELDTANRQLGLHASTIADQGREIERMHGDKMRFFDALLSIHVMDVFTREGEQEPHEVMRAIASRALEQGAQEDKTC